MNDDARLDRVIRGHLEITAPSRAPAHLRDEILSTTSTQQPRSALVARPWLSRRITSMLPITTLAAAAAVLLAVGVALGPNLSSRDDGSVAAPSTDAVGTLTPLPSELMRDWIGDPPTSPDWGIDYPAHSLLWLRSGSAELVGGYETSRISDAGLDADGALVVSNPAPLAFCPEPAVGTYDWSLSDGGQWLTLTARDDGCAARRGFMERTWLRTQSQDGSASLGVVEPGTYASTFLTPRAPCCADWTNDPGSFTYTVPDGWANSDDHPERYILTPSDQYSPEWRGDPSESTVWPSSIAIYADPAAVLASEPCTDTADPSIEKTPEALAAYLATRTELEVSEPMTVEFGGRPGVMVDLAIAAGSPGSCGAETPVPIVPLFLDDDAEPDWGLGIGGQAAVAGSDPQRLIFLDIGQGDTVLIQLDSITEAGFDAFVDEAMPIVESFRFAD
jgi:hypothetical protein